LDPVELTRIAGEFDTHREAIASALKKFEGEIAVIAAKWTGRAGMGFQNVAESWRQKQTELTELLRLSADDIRLVAGINSRANDEALQGVKIPMPLDTKGD
jgi:WXG100 family type VII secretion target